MCDFCVCAAQGGVAVQDELEMRRMRREVELEEIAEEMEPTDSASKGEFAKVVGAAHVRRT